MDMVAASRRDRNGAPSNPTQSFHRICSVIDRRRIQPNRSHDPRNRGGGQ